MNKENLPPDPQPAIITDEQRVPISRNFRAAKALLARKRPFDLSSPPPLSKCINANGSCPRTPLSEIRNGARSENPFLTPAKPATDDASILDEEFDDAFFREVDVICEQSAAKKEKLSPESAAGVVDVICEQSTEKKEKLSPQSTVDDNASTENSLQDQDLGIVDDDSVPRKYYEYLEKLNDAQKEAACSDIAVPLMIVAGPGSGKTSTMVGRVLTLLKEGIGPTNILAMTFTTAAATEMKDRIGKVVGKAIAKELMISTFHSFCLQLCRSHAEKLGRTQEFQVYGHGQQRKAVIEALRLMEDGVKKGQELGQKIEEFPSGDLARSLKEKSKKWLNFLAQG